MRFAFHCRLFALAALCVLVFAVPALAAEGHGGGEQKAPGGLNFAGLALGPGPLHAHRLRAGALDPQQVRLAAHPGRTGEARGEYQVGAGGGPAGPGRRPSRVREGPGGTGQGRPGGPGDDRGGPPRRRGPQGQRARGRGQGRRRRTRASQARRRGAQGCLCSRRSTSRPSSSPR